MSPPPTQVEPTLFSEPYSVGAESPMVVGAPLATWSSKCFTGTWTAANARPLQADLKNAEGRLAGSLRIADTATGLVLTHCMLFHDRWAYAIGEFSSASAVVIDRLDPRAAETLFTERKLQGDQDQIVPYDRASLDRRRILEFMMFYKLAGGSRYTGLSNRYQHALDLSDQLKLGRAILIGLGPSVSSLQVNGQAILPEERENAAWYRFVIPVHTVAPGR